MTRLSLRLLPLMLLVAMSCLAEEPPLPPVSAELVLKTETPTLREPLIAELTLRNDSDEQLELDLGRNYIERMSGTIIGPDAERVAFKTPLSEGLAMAGRVTLPARGTFQRRILLDQWYRFPRPGTYTIALNIAGVTSEPATLTVDLAPLDERELERTAAALEAEANAPLDAQKRIDAARALAAIGDPIVVPHLSRLTASPHLGVYLEAIDGLARIDDPRAIDTLSAAAAAPDEIRRQLADQRLTEARRRASAKESQ